MGDALGVVPVGHSDLRSASVSATTHASHRELRVDGVPVLPARRQDGGCINGDVGVFQPIIVRVSGKPVRILLQLVSSRGV